MAYGRDSYRPGRVPKVVRCNAGRDEAAVYKNLGNSQRIKFLWAETVTLISGSVTAEYELMASGTFGAGKTVDKPDHYSPGGGYYGKDLSDLHVWATPLAEPDGFIYVDIDTVADTVFAYSSELTDIGLEVDVLYFTT